MNVGERVKSRISGDVRDLHSVPNRMQYAEQMIKEYLGEDYRLHLNKMERTLGNIKYADKLVTLSYKLILKASDKFFDSVLFHEIAHGIAYPHCGHGDIEFRRWCAYFGAHSPRAIRFNTAPVAARQIHFPSR